MTTARDLFRVGDRVRENDQAPRRISDIRGGTFRVGTIIGYCHKSKPYCVRVHWDGDSPRSNYAYHMRFIDRVDGEATR